MNKDLIAIFEYLEREKGIKKEVVIGAIEESLKTAARKSIHGSCNVTVSIHPKSGHIDVFCEKQIVEKVTLPAQQISLSEARKLDPDCELGQYIDVIATPKDFGRIAAQKARQIIGQKLRGAERDVIYEEYRHRMGELISGSVKRLVKGFNVVVDLGKVEGLMPTRHYPKTETYQIGDRVLALLLEVKDTENGGAEVILSRSHPDFVKQLFMQEVPEVNDGTVSIERIVREPGYRVKLAVKSNDGKVDPVGACVGTRGIRIKNVLRELKNEKIDVIPYAADPLELLQNALSPIVIRKLTLNEDNQRVALVVDDEDLATVIGKKGMNARLLGQLINLDVEIKRMSDYNTANALHRAQLASSDDPGLSEPIETIEGVNSLVVNQLIAEGFNTLRKLLLATPEQLAAVPGISLEMADKILEHIRKQRT